MKYHLAHLNVARLLKPLDHPDSAGFYNNVERINQLAESSDGFIWRLKEEEVGTDESSKSDDPLLVATLSVWKDVEALKNFSFKTEHGDYVKKRKEWFSKLDYAYVVLWWIKENHRPDIFEAMAQLKFLQKNGPTQKAFSFRQQFPAPSE